MVVGAPRVGVKSGRCRSRRRSQAPSDRRMRRRFTRCSEPRSGMATNSVSSPAIEPATSGQRARSRAAAMACAEPGSVRRTSSNPASWISSGRSDRSLRRRSSPDVSASIEARRQGVRRRALARDLDQPELGDVAADRRLGRPEAALAEGGGELLLGPDRALVDEVADRPLAELLHDLHRARPQLPRPSSTTTTTAARPNRYHDEDVERARPQVAEHEVDRARPDTSAATMPDDERRDRRRPRRPRRSAACAPRTGPAPAVIGVAMRKRTARPTHGQARPAAPAEIEMPERLMPGMRASAWAAPMPIGDRERHVPDRPVTWRRRGRRPTA